MYPHVAGRESASPHPPAPTEAISARAATAQRADRAREPAPSSLRRGTILSSTIIDMGRAVAQALRVKSSGRWLYKLLQESQWARFAHSRMLSARPTGVRGFVATVVR